MWRTSAAALLAGLLALAPAYAQERNRIKITDFTINGVKSVPRGELRNALSTAESSWLPWGKKRYFNRAQFEADLKRILIFYADRGFPDAKVEAFDLKLNQQQDEIAITVNVQEGEPIVVQEVRFNGFDGLWRRRVARMKASAPLKAGAPLDRAAMMMTRERALDEFRDQGYPYATVRVHQSPGGAPRTVVVTYEGTPGQLARFGEISVTGNSSVSDAAVIRHLTFRPGRRFRLGQIQESQRRLYNLELFEFVNVDPVDPPEGADGKAAKPEQVPVRVTVTEGKHRKLNLGGGYGSEEKVRAEANWRHVNFFGGARTAGIETRWSSLDRGVRLNFQQPYIFSPRISLTASGEAWYTREPLFTLDTGGARITLHRRFSMGGPISTSRLVSTLSIGLVHNRESYTIDRRLLEDLARRDEIIALKLDPRTGVGRGVLSALEVGYSRNTTGNILNAQRGYLASIHYEEAGKLLRGDFDYRELTLEGRHYLPLFKGIVWANRARAGAITGTANEDGDLAPFFKRYFLGGSSSLRGWGRYQVAPLSGSGLPLGGHSMIEASTELRIPVWRSLSVVLFADAGNVWSKEWHFEPRNLRYDVGPGLRYDTPIGPVRFDLGYQVNPIDGLLVEGKEQPRQFRMHFSIGQAF